MCELICIPPGVGRRDYLAKLTTDLIGVGYAYASRGKLVIKKFSPNLNAPYYTPEQEADFLSHLPHDGFTILQVRGYGRVLFGIVEDHQLHPWRHGVWATAGIYGCPYAAMPNKEEVEKACKGGVDSERVAAFLGKYGIRKTLKMAKVCTSIGGFLSINHRGKLLMFGMHPSVKFADGYLETRTGLLSPDKSFKSVEDLIGKA